MENNLEKKFVQYALPFEFIKYEQALALWEIGYNEPSLRTYFQLYGNFKYGDSWAPLKQQVFRWFRENYDLYYIIAKSKLWFVCINGVNIGQSFDTYEEAENACIDKLIEIAKQQVIP
jgi:hypothetical protein